MSIESESSTIIERAIFAVSVLALTYELWGFISLMQAVAANAGWEIMGLFWFEVIPSLVIFPVLFLLAVVKGGSNQLARINRLLGTLGVMIAVVQFFVATSAELRGG
jgi:hypothetical protein